MTRSWGPRAWAVAFLLFASVTTADAQTFIARSVPAGNTVEVLFGSAVGKGTANEQGDATIVLSSSPVATQEMAAAITADTCGNTTRLLLAARGADPPPPGVGCQRRLVPGFFVFRHETSVVVDLAPSVPVVRIRQGRVPDSWLQQGPLRTGRTAPRGLVVFGGGGYGQMPETVDQLCGNTSPCDRENTKLNFMGGAAYWLSTWLGAEGTFLKPLAVKVSGSGEIYDMIGSVSTRLVTASAIGGWPVRAARIYGRVGGAYHLAVVETEQATFARTISEDGITTTYPASTQTFTYDTVGWGLLLGAGIEGWASDSAGFFAEVSWIDIEGKEADQAGPRVMKDRLRTFIAGVRVHIGHRR